MILSATLDDGLESELHPNSFRSCAVTCSTMTAPSTTSPVSDTALDTPLTLGSHTFSSRLIVGTGKYATFEMMQECLAASEAEVITVAVRRERLVDSDGRNILDFIDLDRFTILPNTAGCFAADEAVRVARMGREILTNLGNPGADWVKLEVLGDTRTLLPDPVATLEATEQLVADGFQVLCATRRTIPSRPSDSRMREQHR